MREGWREVTLENISTKIGDGLHGTPKYDENGGYYFINGNNLQNGKIIISTSTNRISEDEFSKIKKDLNNRTILLQINGTIGNLAFYQGENIALGKSACYINLVPEVDKYYIRYVLEYDNFQKYALLFATGSTIKNLGLKAVRNYKFSLPPFETQKKIASILSGYDDLIENNLKRIKILEEMAQQTYEEWFVRMRFPGHETAEINAETGLPEGWEKVKLGELADINKTSLKKNFNGKIKYIDIASVSPHQVGELIEYDFKDAPGRARRIVKNGDIIWSCVRPNRRSHALIIEPEDNLIASTGFCVISGKKLPFVYLYHFLTTDDFVGYLTNLAGGAAYPAVTQNHFEEAMIIVPTNALINDFVKKFESSKYLIKNLQNQNQRLREARDILLPRLMMGMIEV